jgi:hypothetical protein
MPGASTYAVPAVASPTPVAPPAAKARPVDPNLVMKDMIMEQRRVAEVRAVQESSKAAKKQKAEIRAPLPAARSASYRLARFDRSCIAPIPQFATRLIRSRSADVRVKTSGRLIRWD